MNVWTKLQTVRQLMSKATLKKTGENKYSKYNYYTLDDILPALTQFLTDQKLVTTLDMGEEKSIYRVINAEKPEEVVEFSCPTVMAEMKGSTKIQELGSTMTYIHRYLVLWAFSICEPEWVEIAKEETDRKKAEAKEEAARKKAEADVARRDAQAKREREKAEAEIPECVAYEKIKATLVEKGYSEYRIQEWIKRQALLKDATITDKWLEVLYHELEKKMKEN